jgi:hypothetical protein
MPKHKILVLGEHSHGKGPNHERAMNIACGVVIAVVIVAMIVATIVYFCVQKSGDGGGGGFGVGAKKVSGPVPAPVVNTTKHATPGTAGTAGIVGPADNSKAARFGQVPMGQAPATDGILFPRLSAQDERELAKTHQLSAVKNYAQGQRNAILSDMKYNMIHDEPPLFGTADFFPYRGKEDERMYQLQTEQARKYRNDFNLSDQQRLLQDQGVRPQFT